MKDKAQSLKSFKGITYFPFCVMKTIQYRDVFLQYYLTNDHCVFFSETFMLFDLFHLTYSHFLYNAFIS